MRDQIIALANKTMVLSTDLQPGGATTIGDPDAEIRAAIEEEDRQAEAEVDALSKETGRPPGFFSDVG